MLTCVARSQASITQPVYSHTSVPVARTAGGRRSGTGSEERAKSKSPDAERSPSVRASDAPPVQLRLRLTNLGNKLAYNATAVPTIRDLSPQAGRAVMTGVQLRF